MLTQICHLNMDVELNNFVKFYGVEEQLYNLILTNNLILNLFFIKGKRKMHRYNNGARTLLDGRHYKLPNQQRIILHRKGNCYNFPSSLQNHGSIEQTEHLAF